MIKVIEIPPSWSFVRSVFRWANVFSLTASKNVVIAGVVAVIALAAPATLAQNNGDTLIWNSTGPTDWSANSLIWWDATTSTAVKLNTGVLRHNNYSFIFADPGTNSTAAPSMMTTNGQSFYSTSITFQDWFNATNTTTLTDGSSTASNLVLGESGGQNSNIAAPWSITNNATSGTVSFALSATGNSDLSLALFSSGTVTVASGATVNIGVSINNFDSTHTGGITKNGGGVLSLSGPNTYTGATIINAGRLEATGTGALGSGTTGTSAITVNTGGTLLLSGSSAVTDRINNNATMTLNGGTFQTGGLSERGGTLAAPTAGLGALTLASTSTIVFGPGNTSVIEFSGVGSHAGGSILQIIDWDGIPVTGGGTERLLFAGSATSFTSLYSQSEVSFNNIFGYEAVQFAGFFEVTAIPEPSTYVGGALALLSVAYLRRRRFRATR